MPEARWCGRPLERSGTRLFCPFFHSHRLPVGTQRHCGVHGGLSGERSGMRSTGSTTARFARRRWRYTVAGLGALAAFTALVAAALADAPDPRPQAALVVEQT